MNLELLSQEFSVLKYPAPLPPPSGIWFAAHTDSEFSLVCESRFAPQGHCAREDGWRAFRVAGQLDFSLVGILARITDVLGKGGISVFCVSTFDTDYVLVKSEKLGAAVDHLSRAGYEFISSIC